MKNTKLILFMVFTLLFCLTFSSCSTNITSNTSENQSTVGINEEQSEIEDNKQPSTEETEKLQKNDYSITERNGKYYIVFDDVSLYESGEDSEVASLDFKSIKQFKDTVTKGLLSDLDKHTIATAFPKNENGFKMCDFDKLYTPILPLGSVINGVSWLGESYSFSINVDDKVFGVIHCYSREHYDAIYQSEYDNYFEKDTITVSKEETVDGKTITYYFTSVAKLMQIRYSSTFEGTKYAIDKTYRLETNNEYSLTNVTMYCVDGEKTYVVDLFGFDEEPNDSWLFEFGLVEYVD